MSEEIITANEGAVETNPTVQSNISASDFIARRLGKSEEAKAESVESTPEQATEEVPVVEEANVEETNNVEQSTTEEVSVDSASEDALSQFNLDEMSDEELREMSEKLGSRAVARFGELTARRKQAEERAKELEARMAQMAQSQQNEPPQVKNNPLAKITDPKKLQQEAKTAKQVIEWADELLFDHSDSSPDEIIATVKGKELTKAQVRKSLRHNKNVYEKYVPAQMHKLKKVHEIGVAKKQFEEKARTELPWVGDEKSDMNKMYNAMLNDPRLTAITKRGGEVSAQIPYLLAHATNSMYQRKPLNDQGTGAKSPTLTPPKSTPSSARSEKTSASTAKKSENLRQQYRKSGRTNDFITLRTQQLSNR